jgi:hypothetical protein
MLGVDPWTSRPTGIRSGAGPVRRLGLRACLGPRTGQEAGRRGRCRRGRCLRGGYGGLYEVLMGTSALAVRLYAVTAITQASHTREVQDTLEPKLLLSSLVYSVLRQRSLQTSHQIITIVLRSALGSPGHCSDKYTDNAINLCTRASLD